MTTDELYTVALEEVGDPDRAALLVSWYMRGQVDRAIIDTCKCGEPLDVNGEHRGGYGAFCG